MSSLPLSPLWLVPQDGYKLGCLFLRQVYSHATLDMEVKPTVACNEALQHAGTVVGGTTLRMILDRTDGRSGGGCVVLDVLTLAVDQRRGVCGHGHGTRLVNGLKALLAARAASMRVTSAVLLAQADLGEQVMSAVGN